MTSSIKSMASISYRPQLKNLMQSVINPNFNYEYIPNLDWVSEELVGSDNLLIVVGDSWTWGATLCRPEFVNVINDREYRTEQIYGYHLHKKLNYDWVNLAVCGTDNIAMINHCWKFIKTLNKQYKKIHIVMTLTELGRELTGKNFLQQQKNYERLQGPDWPTFDQLVCNQASDEKLDFFKKECIESELEIIYALELYLAIKDSKSFNQLLESYERYTFDLIKRLLTGPNITCSVARNYTDSYDNNKDMAGINFIDKKWTDIIAERGNLEPYPKGIRVLGQLAIKPLLEYAKANNIGNKVEILELLDLASEALHWFDHSTFNNQRQGYKHPKEIGHQWWAEYLYDNIQW